MSMQAGKPKTSRSLAATLIMAFVPLSLAALLIAYIPQFFFFLQARQEGVNSQQQFTALEAANTVASFIQKKFGDMEAAVRVSDVTSATPMGQRNVLGNLLGLDPAFRQLLLLDSQGQELATVSRLSQAASGQLVDWAESELFIQVKQGNRYISPVYVDDVTSEPLVIVAIPATDVFGDFQGTLVAEVNLKFMWDLVDKLEVGETGLAYVVDRQGNLIAFGDVSRVLRGENVSHLDIIGEFMYNPVPVGEATTSVVQGIDGTAVIGTYVPLGMPDWAVVTELPMAEAFQPGIQSTAILGAVVLIVMILTGLIGVNVARRLAVPLLNLTEAATRIAGGEMELQASMAGPAEVVGLATAFNSMTAQLRDLIGSLEQRVADRTRNLETAAEVARAASSVLDPDDLLHQTVDLVRGRFNLYYVGLFLLDEQPDDAGRTFAVLRAGTGEVGQEMLTQGHRLEVGGDSMIGQCAARAEARIAFDVGEEAARFDNPLLPETRSEMALPLRSRGRVIGAMTVQSVEEAAFDEADIAVMQTMADQVAVVIDNAQLLAQTQAALAEMEVTQRRYLGQVWTEYVKTAEATAYETKHPDLTPLNDEVLPEIQQALKQQGVTALMSKDGRSALVAPLALRGQIVGALGIHDEEGARQWSEDEIAIFEAIIERVALAAENLRLLNETQRRAAREQLTAEVTSRIRETLDVDNVLRTAAREIRDALHLHDVMVRLELPEQ